MPLLTRMVPAPLVVEIRRGAVRDLGAVLADQRISSGGRVALALSAGSGGPIAEGLREELADADFFTVAGGTVDGAVRLVEQARRSSYDALVGVGGGRVLDTTKFAAARLGLPMVAVATNLAHDGIASPVSTLDNDAGRGSYGVPAPLAVLVDLELVRRAPDRSVRSGIGEVLSNLNALSDWHLGAATTGEAIDGLAVALARSAGEAVLHHPDDVASDSFLGTLAEALVLSGLAMVVAGTSRPSSGACHEISHAIDMLHRDRAGYHGEQVGMGAAFASWLRGDHDLFASLVPALRRHRLPVTPGELGFDADEFSRILAYAPQTRPGRHTVLEHRGLTGAELRRAVDDYLGAVA